VLSIKAASHDFRNPVLGDRKTLARLAKPCEKMDDAGSFTGQAMPNDLPKIAWLSPFPPQKSGIANYSYWLVKALQTRFDIDLYYDSEPPSEAIRNEFNVYPLSVFAKQKESYDEVIYHLGNHTGFHKEIYKLAWQYPGTVVLHDYNLNAFMHDAFYCQNEEHLYKQALLEGYGGEGLEEFQALTRGQSPDTARFPMSHAVVGRSKKAIVHHRWVKNQFANHQHIEVVPLLAKLDHQPSVEELKLFKKKFSISDNHFIVSCLGFINSNKLPGLQVEVVKRLIDDGYPVQMIFAGEPAPDVKMLEQEVRTGSYSKDIIFTGYQGEADYFRALFASDIVINLRNPSMGEASLTLMHALAAAKPTIISDVNQYREFPDKVCWKLTHDENQAEVLYAYLSALLSDKNLRAAISNNSAEYVRNVLAWEQIIAQWIQIILR
jgi:glycosyltransferase involved in cell wall biosynthesis